MDPGLGRGDGIKTLLSALFIAAERQRRRMHSLFIGLAMCVFPCYADMHSGG